MKSLPFLLLTIVGLAELTSAQTNTWTNAIGGDWDVNANWTPSSFPNAVGADARITNFTAVGSYTISASTAQTNTVGRLDFGNNTTTNAITNILAANAGLRFEGTNAQINFFTAGSASVMTIAAPISLATNTTISLTRNGGNQVFPNLSGPVDLGNSELRFGSSRSANIRMTGLISGSGGSLVLGVPGAERSVALENTGSTFSGGVIINGLNALTLGDSSNSITGSGGGGIAGTGALTLSDASRGTPIGGSRSAQIHFNGNNASMLGNNTATNVVTNAISIASNNYGIFTMNRGVNYAGDITGGGTLFQIVGLGGVGSERGFALGASQTSFTGTYVLREGQLVVRGFDFGSGAKVQFNSANTNGGTALVGVTASNGTATFSSALDAVNNGNSIFIQTGGNTTFQLTGDFSNSGTTNVTVAASAGSNNTIINGVSDTSNLRVGMTITGTGIAGGTVIQGIGTNTIQISAATTGTVTNFTQLAGTAGTVTFTRGNASGTTGYNVGTGGGTATFELSGTGSLNNPTAITSGGGSTATSLRLANTSGTQIFSGSLTGNGTLTRAGVGGASVLLASNSYSGVTTLSGGTLRGGDNQSFGTNSLVLSNGTLASDSSAARTWTNAVILTGNVTLGETSIGTGDLTLSNVSLGAAIRTVTVDNTLTTFAGVVSGSGGLDKTGAGTLVLAGTNSYTGNTTVTAGALELGTNGTLAFVIGGSGTNNGIGGSGTLQANGRFSFNLVGAATNSGASWTIVANTLTQSYGTNFLVNGFSGAGGNWTNNTNGVDYVFQQATGLLTVGAPATNNYAGWVSYWQGVDPGFTNTAGTGNPDGDPYNNNSEFAFDGNPTVGSPAFLTAAKAGTNTVFNWAQRKNPPGGVTYQVKTTPNLTTGPWTNAAVTVSNSANQSGLNIPADYERKEFIVPGTNNQFFRVEAVVAP